jgi:bacterial leucyl aminopeptidase
MKPLRGIVLLAVGPPLAVCIGCGERRDHPGSGGACPSVGDSLYTIDNESTASSLLSELREDTIRQTITTLSTQFPKRYYALENGPAAHDWLKAGWQGMAEGRSDVTFWEAPATEREFATVDTFSTVLQMEGSDAALRNQVVVIGGHIDSMLNSPGADDNASGVATIQDVVRTVFATGLRPCRSLHFVAFMAEEIGARGSEALAKHYKDNNVDVVGMLNLDMTGYRGGDHDITMITTHTDSRQTQFLRDLLAHYTPEVTTDDSAAPEDAASDHVPFDALGYAASFPHEAPFEKKNPYIHSANDTLENMGGNADHCLKFAKLTAVYVAELGKGTCEKRY